MTTRAQRTLLMSLSAILLAATACVYTDRERSFGHRRQLPDGTQEYEDNTQRKSELQLDDRLYDTLDDLINDSDDDDGGDGGVSQLPSPEAEPPRHNDAEPPQSRQSEDALPLEPAVQPHPGDRADRETVPAVQTLTINAVHITLNATKQTIEDTDQLAFTMQWNTDINNDAAQIILETFDGAAITGARVLSYAGPAPAGFDLAALLGLKRMELGTTGMVFEDPAEQDAWGSIEDLLIDISQTEGTVRVNDTTVLELTDRANALDAMRPA